MGLRIPMMITADYATVDHSTGKIHVLGIFRNIYTDRFPFQHSRMCLAMIIEGEIADSRNPHELTVTLVDEDGHEVFALQGSFELPRSAPGIPPHCNLLMELNDLPFEKQGQYCFHVRVNVDEAVGDAVVQVVKRESGNE